MKSDEMKKLSYDAAAFHRHFHAHIERWMLFVDGENLTLRAQEISKNRGMTLKVGPYYQKDTFIWPEQMLQTEIILRGIEKNHP